MRTKKTAGARIFAAAVTAALLLSGCNDFTEHDTIPQAGFKYEGSFQANVVNHAKTAANGCDMTRIRKVKFNNWYMDSGWKNRPCRLTLYTETNITIPESMKGGLLVFSDLPFDEFGIDAYGHTVEWTANDAGYDGAPKTYALKKSTDLSGYEKLIVPYVLTVYEPVASGEAGTWSRLEIIFIDKDGNESNPVSLNNFTLAQ